MTDRASLSEVLLSQRRAWQHGERPALEELLAAHPHLAGEDEAVLDLVYQEVVLREEAGERPRLADYAGRFPHLTDALRVQFEVDDALAGGLPSTVTAPGGQGGVADLPPLEGVDLLDELGRGAMGIVYRGWQRAAKRPVAVKILASEMPEGRARTEVEAASRLQHPHIVTMYEVKEHAGRTALVLEYVEGGNLAQKLAGKPQPPRDAAQFVQTLAWAMAYAHGRGVVHRDLKPSNILLSAGPDAPLKRCQPRISDFGLAKLMEASAHLTRTNDILGTPSYMAPEQAASAGAAGPTADVYALGAILYECLTGRPPFVGQSLLDTLDQVRSRDPVPPSRLAPTVPRDLERICLKCLEKQPAHRYATARELAEDLAAFLKDEPIQARSVGWGKRLRGWLRKPRNAWVALAGGVAALALLAALIWLAGHALAVLGDSSQATARLSQKEKEAAVLRYAANLLRAGAMARDDPSQALRLLEDEEACPPARRGFSWGVLRARCKHWIRCDEAHAGAVVVFAGSPDGKTLASSDGRRVRLFGEARAEWDVDGRVTALALAGGTVAVGTASGHIEIRDAATGKRRGGFTTGPVAGIALASRGRWLAVNAGGVAALWDARSFKLRRALPGDADPACGIALSADDTLVACAGRDGIIRVWSASTGKLLAELPGHGSRLRCLAISQDGKQLAGGTADGSARLWDIGRGVSTHSLSGLVGPIAGLAFHPGGQSLALAGQGRDDPNPLDVQGWNLAEGRAGDPVRGHGGAVGAVFVEGGTLATAGADGTVKRWAFPLAIRTVAMAGHAGRPGTVALSPEGGLLAWVVPSSEAGGPDEAAVLDLGRNALRTRLRGHLRSIRHIALSPDGRHALTAGGGEKESAEVLVWDLKLGRPVQVLAGHESPCDAVAISPDGERLATATARGEVGVWRLGGGRLWRAAGPTAPVALCFDGPRLLAFGAGKRLVFDTKGKASEEAFFPEAARVAVGGKTTAWAGRGGKVGVDGADLETGMKEVWHLALSGDGRTLAVAGSGTAAQLWDVPTRQLRATLDGHRGGACFAAFAGAKLVTASRRGTARLWPSAQPREK